jgi:hypothetical protein
VPVPSQECVRGINVVSVSIIYLLDFVSVLTAVVFFVFHLSSQNA